MKEDLPKSSSMHRLTPVRLQALPLPSLVEMSSPSPCFSQISQIVQLPEASDRRIILGCLEIVKCGRGDHIAGERQRKGLLPRIKGEIRSGVVWIVGGVWSDSQRHVQSSLAPFTHPPTNGGLMQLPYVAACCWHQNRNQQGFDSPGASPHSLCTSSVDNLSREF